MASDVIDRIVEQNLGVYRAAPSRLQEDVSQEAQVASDYRGRLVYELLQNADDAMEGHATQRDRVAFLVTDDALWMANSGRALTDPDVQGLCGLGASSKVDAAGTKRASIGHKGLGFKSVLEITDAPESASAVLGGVSRRSCLMKPARKGCPPGTEPWHGSVQSDCNEVINRSTVIPGRGKLAEQTWNEREEGTLSLDPSPSASSPWTKGPAEGSGSCSPR